MWYVCMISDVYMYVAHISGFQDEMYIMTMLHSHTREQQQSYYICTYIILKYIQGNPHVI